MMKIIFIISFLFSPIFSEEESELNKFEKTLKEEKINSSELKSNESQSNHNNENLFNSNCSYSSCQKYCTHSYKKKKRKSLSEKVDSFFDFIDFFHDIIKPFYTIIAAPIWGPLEIDEYSYKTLSFDKYPFYSTNGMFKINGRNKYVKAELSALSFDNSIHGNKTKVNFQYSGKSGFNYSYFHLKENINSVLINKYMNNFMFHRNFSASNSFIKKYSIDFSFGIGYSNWISNEYKNSGLKINYGIRTFIKPFSLNCVLGYANIGNGLFDISTDISYHYKRYSINLGFQQFVTTDRKIGGITYSISYWF